MLGRAVFSGIQRPVLLILSMAFMLALTFSGHGFAETSDKSLLFILDCSGSMWGRIDGRAKISTAKEALAELVAEVPGDQEMGLVAYGHRRKGDCDDLELIVPLGAAPGDITAALSRLSPKGKTPISGSLVKAGEILGGREGAATVVLVSDGIETCGGDPCRVAAQLKEKGVQAVIHVVGFDVDSQAAEQLACIASAGGGRFFRADSVEELRQALGQVKTSVSENTPIPEPPKMEAAPKTASKSKKIRIAGPGTVVLKPAPWVNMPPRYWALADAETGAEKARGNEDQLRVKGGEYQVVWKQSEHDHGAALLTAVVTVKSGKTVEVPIDTGIRLNVPEGIRPPRSWALVEPGRSEPVLKCKGVLGPEVVPAGSYRLLWHQDEHRSLPLILGDVEIAAGKLNDVILDGGLALQPADWLPKRVYSYQLKNADGETVGRWADLSAQLAPPGTYTLVYRPTEHKNNDIVWGKVEVAAHGFTQVPLNSGIQFIHGDKARPPYMFIMVDLDTQREIAAKETWAPLPVPPGRYRLDWWESQHGSKRETLADEIAVEPGVLLELEM